MTEDQQDKILRKLEALVSRELCNQKLIDRLKRPTWKGRLMVFIESIKLRHVILACALIWAFLIGQAFAVECPTPGEACRILILTPTEEKMLTTQNGILDTAAQGRALELGQFAVYLKTRIAGSPMGETVPIPKPTENKSADPAPAAPKP